jgi:hypothetical protein
MKKKKQHNNRKKKGSGFGEFAIILGGLCVLGFLLGAGFYLFVNTEKQYALDDNLCPKQGARATVAVLLDTTDQLATVTKAAVSARISDTLMHLPRFYRLSVYTMDEEGLQKIPITTVCNPGSSDQMGKLERKGLTANPIMIDEKFSQFTDSIKEAVSKVFKESFEAKQSPLFSAMQDLSMELPRPVAIDKDTKNPGGNKYQAGKNRIIYVTDLFEHTDVFSVYRSGTDFSAFKKSRVTEKFGKKYNQTDLDFWVIRRNTKGLNTIDLQKFWAKVIKFEFESDINSMITLTGEI